MDSGDYSYLDGLDDETANAILQAQMESLSLANGKGKGRAGAQDDAELARHYQTQMWEQGNADDDDFQDQLAMMQAAYPETFEPAAPRRHTTTSPSKRSRSEKRHEKGHEKKHDKHDKRDKRDKHEKHERHSKHDKHDKHDRKHDKRHGQAGPSTAKTCAACADDAPAAETVTTPCNHDYCFSCMRRMFSMSFTDSSVFPPRCCGEAIPFDRARPCLSSEDVKTFKKKLVEHETSNRTYCSNPACAVFIPPSKISGDVVKCHKCSSKTCAICKAAAHKGDCPEDKDTKALLKTAKKTGWMRCKRCKAVIELRAGCNHITCRCHYQFCYQCGKKWKTCGCPTFTAANLIQVAQEVMDDPDGHDDDELAVAADVLGRAPPPRADRAQRFFGDREHFGPWGAYDHGEPSHQNELYDPQEIEHPRDFFDPRDYYDPHEVLDRDVYDPHAVVDPLDLYDQQELYDAPAFDGPQRRRGSRRRRDAELYGYAPEDYAAAAEYEAAATDYAAPAWYPGRSARAGYGHIHEYVRDGHDEVCADCGEVSQSMPGVDMPGRRRRHMDHAWRY